MKGSVDYITGKSVREIYKSFHHVSFVLSQFSFSNSSADLHFIHNEVHILLVEFDFLEFLFFLLFLCCFFGFLICHYFRNISNTLSRYFHLIHMIELFSFYLFFFSGGKWHDLAMVTKNHQNICSWPLFRPHDSLVRGIKVTERDLNSPWEHPRSGSGCTRATFGVLYMQYIQLGSLGRLCM